MRRIITECTTKTVTWQRRCMIITIIITMITKVKSTDIITIITEMITIITETIRERMMIVKNITNTIIIMVMSITMVTLKGKGNTTMSISIMKTGRIIRVKTIGESLSPFI